MKGKYKGPTGLFGAIKPAGDIKDQTRWLRDTTASAWVTTSVYQRDETKGFLNPKFPSWLSSEASHGAGDRYQPGWGTAPPVSHVLPRHWLLHSQTAGLHQPRMSLLFVYLAEVVYCSLPNVSKGERMSSKKEIGEDVEEAAGWCWKHSPNRGGHMLT